jgi:predicted outer membrane repeat protein
MTDNRRYNHFVIIALILTMGLGLALALSLLAKSQSLAAHEVPEAPATFTELVHSGNMANAPAAEDFDNAPIPPDRCFATYNDGTDVFSSSDASAVQEAIDAATSSDTVKVSGTCIGIVQRAGLTQTIYISKSLTLEGGHTPNDWTLEPDLDTYPTLLHANHLGRVIVIFGTYDVTLDNLYLMGGLADDGTLDDEGGGIWSNSGLTLTDVTFSGNKAQIGGAMYNNWRGGYNPILTNVTFSDNTAGSSGGAMYNYCVGYKSACGPFLTNVTFSDNSAGRSGGAMYNYAYYSSLSPILTNVTFSGNTAGRSGGAMYNNDTYYGYSSPKLTNVTFSGNTAGRSGGAMYNDGSSYGIITPILKNVTFSGNTAGRSGGAMYNYDDGLVGIWPPLGSPKVQNSILWNNQADDVTGTITATIYNNSNSSIYLIHSLVQGSGGSSNWMTDSSLVDGGGNIDTNPLFILNIDPSAAPTTTGNLRLQTGSPAINAGNNSFVTVPTDLDGNERIIGCIVDMGAYETMGIPCQIFMPLIFR